MGIVLGSLLLAGSVTARRGDDGTSLLESAVMLKRQPNRTTRWPRSVTLGLTVQAGLVTAATAIGVFADPVTGRSMLAGALASVLPTAWWALKVFGRQRPIAGSEDAAQNDGLANAGAAAEVGSMYRAEITKLVTMMVLLVLALLVVKPLNAGALIGGFLAAYLAFVVSMSCASLSSGSTG